MKRSELKRGSPLARGHGLARSVLQSTTRPKPKPRRPRDTGPAPAVRALVAQRMGGACTRCQAARGTDVHHRKPRGAGGRSAAGYAALNRPGNLVWLCRDCHGWVESNRREAYRLGWLLQEHVVDPAAVPLRTLVGTTIRLADDGSHTEERINQP